MILEHEYINYDDNYNIVTDLRILKAIKNKGFIIDYDKNYKYVNDYNYYNSNKNINQFYYKNELYKIEYFDGCFNPFIIKIIKKWV